MELVALLFALLVIWGAGGLTFWAMWRSSALAERLHPLTPEQRRRKRKAYTVMVPLMLGAVGLGAVVASGGAGAVVALAIIAAIFLFDALLTPWLHYRRARRGQAGHR